MNANEIQMTILQLAAVPLLAWPKDPVHGSAQKMRQREKNSAETKAKSGTRMGKAYWNR